MGPFGRRGADRDAARGRAEGDRILRQAGEREERAARHMAARAGYDVAGAEHVAFEAPRSNRCLVVRHDRIDLYDEVPDDDAEPTHAWLWRRDVTDVHVEGEGLLVHVTLTGPRTSLTVEMPRTQAARLQRLLSAEAVEAPEPERAPGRTDLDVLRQLAAMRDEGLVTPAEYDAKKTEILRRM